MTNGNYHFIISVIGKSGWILQFWMIKDEWSFCFPPTITRRFWLDIQAFPECAIYTLSPLGSNPGILGKSGKTPGVHSNTRAPAACYIPETRVSTSELRTLPEHCWISTTAVKWRHSLNITQHKRMAAEATQCPKGAPKGAPSEFKLAPPTSEADWFSFRLQKIRFLSRKMGMAEVLQETPGWNAPERMYLL